MAEKKDDKPSGPNYELIASRLKKLSSGDHINDITEKLSEVYLNHKKSLGNKRTMKVDDAEKLGHQLYDTLIDHAAAYHKLSPEETKALKGKKSDHGELLLDHIVEKMFGLKRSSLVKRLKEHADNGENFSDEYINKIFSKHLAENYTGHLHGAILGDINEDHVDDLKKQIAKYGEKHQLDGRKYKPALKSNKLDTVLSTYVGLASEYHQDAPKPK